MPLYLAPEHHEIIRAHAARDYPNECCGFLIGKTPSEISAVFPAANTRDDSPRNRFEIDPLELVRMDRNARADGMSVVGFYHSHPDAPAKPSNFDREHAWPGYCYIIISVPGGQPREMTAWLLRDDRSGFDPDQIAL
jgi:proteasome lid subunit RPN8/RPN11